MTEIENLFAGRIISPPVASETRRCLMLFTIGDNSFDTLDLFCCPSLEMWTSLRNLVGTGWLVIVG